MRWEYAERGNEEHEEIVDREALEALAGWCGQFSPAVAVEPSAAPESLLLDITGLEHLFGGEAALAERIFRELSQCGLSVQVGIADTSGAAWAVAHYQQGKAEGGRRKSTG